MAVCQICRQEMTQGVSCTLENYDDFGDGVVRRRIRYKSRSGSACGDCGCPSNGLHHPGCDMEKCPKCRRQAFGCGCVGGNPDLEPMEVVETSTSDLRNRRSATELHRHWVRSPGIEPGS